MMSSKRLVLAALAASACTVVATAQYLAGVCPDMVPAFVGGLNVVDNTDSIQQYWWSISPTAPVTNAYCNTSAFVSQFSDECLGQSPYVNDVRSINNGCSFVFSDYATQVVTLNINCDPSITDWLSIPGYVSLENSDNVSLYTVNAFYAGVCPTPATTTAPELGTCPEIAPSFVGPISLQNGDNSTTPYLWSISPTELQVYSPEYFEACPYAGYVSQYDLNNENCSTVATMVDPMPTASGCNYAFTSIQPYNQVITLVLTCDPTVDGLLVSETGSVTNDGDDSFITLTGTSASVCPSNSTNNVTVPDPTYSPPTVDPTPDPIFQLGLSYTGPIWILIYIAIGALVGSAVIFLVILSFIALRKRQRLANGDYQSIEDCKKAAPLPISEAALMNAPNEESINA